MLHRALAKLAVFWQAPREGFRLVAWSKQLAATAHISGKNNSKPPA